jgi:hypothetical protein
VLGVSVAAAFKDFPSVFPLFVSVRAHYTALIHALRSHGRLTRLMSQFTFTLKVTKLLFLQNVLLPLLLVLFDRRSAIVLPELIGSGIW